MPSFDVVSQVNLQEVKNAVDQAMREVITRFDFKGSKSKIAQEADGLHLLSDDEFKMKSLIDVLKSKLIKRGIDLKSVEFGKIEPGPDGLAKCLAKIIAGIPQEKAKEIVKIVKDSQLKVQSSIQGDQVRVTGKKRDDLQAAIALLKTSPFSLPLQFTNYRD
ncbi:MAG: YajQ family cyclic di-GMP-binding protein [Deltaproteobacteria bacterium]|nr:YajQ family cyclic di-GMP-binding protein [Deltaproteobacteria bacterium]